MNENSDTMMTELQDIRNPFVFSSAEVRTAVDDLGEVWFCARDVYEALEIAWRGTKSLQNMPEKWQMVRYLRTISGEKEALFVSEAGAYQLIFRSNKPKAQEFAEWVCEDVLPAIRKRGYFGRVDARQELAVTRELVHLLKGLPTIRDAFVYQVTLRRVRGLCNLLGEPMPDIDLLGQDRHQTNLPV